MFAIAGARVKRSVKRSMEHELIAAQTVTMGKLCQIISIISSLATSKAVAKQ